MDRPHSHDRSLADTNTDFADDDGTADPRVREALETAIRTGTERDYLRAVAELCVSRLLVPIVATGDEHEGGQGGAEQASRANPLEPDPTRGAEMAAVLLQRADGARAMLTFTGVDALTAWNPKARPVPATLDRVAAACRDSGAIVLLVDFDGPSPLALEEPVLGQLAQSHRLTELEDGTFAWLRAAG